MDDQFLRIGQAADLLDVSVDTLRRWEEEGALRAERSDGGQRLIPVAEVRRLLVERAGVPAHPPIVASSARNQMEGVVTEVVVGTAAATVEVQAGPFRIVSLMTAESVRALDLQPGSHVIASVKSTNVVIGVPG